MTPEEPNEDRSEKKQRKTSIRTQGCQTGPSSRTDVLLFQVWKSSGRGKHRERGSLNPPMRKHRQEEIRSFSGLRHRVEQAENGNRSPARLRFRLVLREVLCSSVSPAASLSSNANATAFACCANPTTRCVFARMGITTARTVATPVTFARKGD